jgi:hypothetical protein
MLPLAGETPGYEVAKAVRALRKPTWISIDCPHEEDRASLVRALDALVAVANYRHFVPDKLAFARSHGPTFNVHVLEQDTITLSGVAGFGDVHFVGASQLVRVRVTASTIHSSSIVRYRP